MNCEGSYLHISRLSNIWHRWIRQKALGVSERKSPYIDIKINRADEMEIPSLNLLTYEEVR